MADIEVITNAVRLACRAPSKHNSQPWRWVADSTTVNLFLDPARVSYSADRSGREALISCGAVLDHFRVAMAATGWNTTVIRFPDPNSVDHLASISFTTMGHVTKTQQARAAVIAQRRTDRLPLYPPTNWESFAPVLRDAIREGIVMLDVLADDARPQLAYASRLTESLRLYDESYHDEMRWWTTPYSDSEGVPYSALVSEAEAERVDLRRDFPVAGTGSAVLRSRGTKRRSWCYPPRGHPQRRPPLRRGAVCGIAGMHDDGTGDLHLDPPDGARDQPTYRPRTDRKGGCASGFDQSRYRTGDGSGPAADTAPCAV
jgi:hypothetical protein